jgi:pre-rRNA-processing protein TSR1
MDGEEEEEEMEDLVEPGPEEDAESERDVHFADLDEEEEIKQFVPPPFPSVYPFTHTLLLSQSNRLDKWRNRDREKEEQEDLAFPDEIDTPQDVPARTRFARYRGMKSFRTSPWDPYENLPRDYARIFQFEDYKRTERSVIRRTEEMGGVEVRYSSHFHF